MNRSSGLFLVAVMLSVSLGSPGRSAAQASPVLGWCADIIYNGPMYTVCASTPAGVCELQVTDKLKLWQPDSPWEWTGVSDDTVWWWKRCDAQHPTPPPGPPYYYGHPPVEFRCAPGYVRVAGGRCASPSEDFRMTNPSRCEANNGGTPNPATPHPIDILTGSKLLRAVDFANVTKSLLLERFFVSGAYAGASDPATGLVSAAIVSSPNNLANWTFGFSYEVQIPNAWPSPPRVIVLTPAGSAMVFERSSDGTMSPYRPSSRPLPQTDYQLAFLGTWPSDLASLKTAVSSWRLTGPEGETIFLKTQKQQSADPNSSGPFLRARPTRIETRTGNVLTFAFGTSGDLTSLTDSHGNAITFEWLQTSISRAITAANLPNGYKIRYVYSDAAGGGVPDVDRLLSVEFVDPQGAVIDKTTYQYTDSNYPTYVTGAADRSGTLRQVIAYDYLGRATKSSAALDVDSYDVGYGAAGSSFTRTVANPLGKQTIYTYSRSSLSTNDERLVKIEGQPSTNCPWLGPVTFAYNASGFVSSITDEEGRTTSFNRTSRGFASRITQAAGTSQERIANITWSTNLRLPTRIEQPGSVAIDYVYQSGLPVTVTINDLTSFTNPYATNGRTRLWTYGWSPTGQIETIDGPLPGAGDTVTFAYDSTTGYPASMTNELGHVTTITAVDWRGAPTTVVNPNGVTLSLTYDFHGRPLTATLDGSTASTYQFEYNPIGNIQKVTLPGGGYIQYTYDDAGRPTRATNDRGQKLFIAADAMRNLTSVSARTADNLVRFKQLAAYDELGRIIKIIGASAKQTFLFGYDKVGNLTQLTDALGKVSQIAYDPLNRPAGKIDPETHALNYLYDSQDELTLFEDGRGLDTTRTVDGFGQVIAETSPDRGTRSFYYDDAGHLTKLVEADGKETNQTYDAAGRLLTKTFPTSSSENVTYTHDLTGGGNKGIGRPTKAGNGAAVVSWSYDGQGRVVKETRTIKTPGLVNRDYLVTYGYDANGKVAQIGLPSGRVVLIGRAGDGLATNVRIQAPGNTTPQSLLSNIAYEPFGPLSTFTYSNGLVLTRIYDLNYLGQGVEVTDGLVTRLDLTWGRNDNGQVVSVTDAAGSGRGATYTYSNSGRLKTASGPWGQDTYTYDAAGNRLLNKRLIGGSTFEAISVMEPASNRVARVENSAGVVNRTFSYHTTGELASEAYADGRVYRYDYDAARRLASVSQILGGGTITMLGTYGHDALGHRVWSTGSDGTTVHYVYDLQGHLLAEHDGDTASVIREYIWLDNLAVSVYDYTSGSAVRYDIHSGQLNEPLMLTKNNKGKAWDGYLEPYGVAQLFTSTPAISYPGRLPGQWLQSDLPQLHENWFRDYDPTLGRYIEPDPLGLAGGPNAYAYVDGRPTEFIDPDGRFAVPVLVARAAYGGISGAIGGFVGTTGSTGDKVKGALIGAAAGAAVGVFLPPSSGAFISGAAGNLTGQTFGNLLDGRPLYCLDLALAAVSGVGGGLGRSLALRTALTRADTSALQEAVFEGFLSGVSEQVYGAWKASGPLAGER